jgi:hypothetical protein
MLFSTVVRHCDRTVNRRGFAATLLEAGALRLTCVCALYLYSLEVDSGCIITPSRCAPLLIRY